MYLETLQNFTFLLRIHSLIHVIWLILSWNSGAKHFTGLCQVYIRSENNLADSVRIYSYSGFDIFISLFISLIHRRRFVNPARTINCKSNWKHLRAERLKRLFSDLHHSSFVNCSSKITEFSYHATQKTRTQPLWHFIQFNQKE